MKTKLTAFIIVALLAAIPSMAADLTLDQVLAKNADARGGMDKIKAIKNVYVKGSMNMGGMEAPFAMKWSRPDKVRIEFTIQGQTGIQAFDGETGWQVMPFMGVTEPSKMSAEELKQLDGMKDFDGVLVDWKAKGHTVELVGKEEVEGTEAYKIKVVEKSGEESTIFIDAEYFVEIRTVSKQDMGGMQVEMIQTIGDYKEVEGVMLPHSLQIGAPGAPVAQSLTMDTYTINGKLEESEFSMPAGN